MRLRIVIIWCVIVLSSFSFGQTDYINIPRTKISCPVIEGYKLDSISAVLINESNLNEGIQFSDLDGGNFESNTRNFSKEKFEENGMLVSILKDTTVAGFPAKLVVVNNPVANMEMTMLAFGNEKFSAMINALYAFNKPDEFKEKILETIMGVKYDVHKKVNPFEGAKFKFSDNTNFQYTKFGANVYLYASQKDTSEKVAVLQVSYVPGQSLVQVAANAIFQGESEGWESYSFESETYCHENKETCYAITGNCTINGERKKFYYHFITDKRRVLISIFVVVPESKTAIFNEGKAFASGVYIQ